MERLGNDLRVALRGLRRSPLFVAAVLVILGLGIGMAVAVFTVFQAVLLRRLPVKDQDRLAVLWTQGAEHIELAPLVRDLDNIRSTARTMSGIAGVVHWGAAGRAPLRDGSRTVVLVNVGVTANFFDVVGARPFLGRLLRPEDGEHGAPGVMVLAYATWLSQFGGDSSVIGRHLIGAYSDDQATIVGVAPPGLDYPVGVGEWSPFERGSDIRTLAVVRLAPGASAAAASAELLTMMKSVEPTWQLQSATSKSFTTAVVGDVRPVLVSLTAAVVLLLVIACINVGTLFLVRAAARARELAVRRALGASYGDIVRQLLMESAVLALAGGALGVVCANALLRALLVLAPSQLPRMDDVRLHGSLLWMSLGVTSVAVLLFGVLPAFAASRVDLLSSLRSDTRSGTETHSRRTTRQLLVASQIALAVVMLAGAGLLIQSLRRLEQLRLGYRADHLSILAFAWDAKKYWPNKMIGWGDQVAQRIRSLPGVTAVTPIVVPPFVGPNIWVVQYDVEGHPSTTANPAPNVPTEITDTSYFRTFDTPILEGRGFRESDRDGGPYVVVVNESAAKQLWPGENPMGKRIRVPPPPRATERCPEGSPPGCKPSYPWRTVVGVVADTRFRELRTAWPMVYVPWRQMSGWQGYFAVRSTGDIGPLAAATRQVAKDVDPSLVLYITRSMDAYLSEPLAEPRLGALLLTAFGGAAVILAVVGLYGVVASTVRERTREIGIRVALGATPSIIRRGVLREALVVALMGTGIGLAGAFATTRLIRAALFDTSPTDPATLGAVCALLLAIAGLAAYLPARRATHIDPVRALREE